jgi:septal ring factor EnvC (AmiA/AmiB activator)
MGFGSTAKKLQQVADMAEDVYGRLNQLREQVNQTQEAVVETSERVDALDHELAEQRAIVEALAEDRGIDVEAVVGDVHVVDAETAVEEANTAAEDADDAPTGS